MRQHRATPLSPPREGARGASESAPRTAASTVNFSQGAVVLARRVTQQRGPEQRGPKRHFLQLDAQSEYPRQRRFALQQASREATTFVLHSDASLQQQ